LPLAVRYTSKVAKKSKGW